MMLQIRHSLILTSEKDNLGKTFALLAKFVIADPPEPNARSLVAIAYA
jgi:hypothetical protein